MPVRPGEKNAVIQPQITQISQIRENEVVETRGPSCLYLPQESRAAISHSSNLCNLRNLWDVFFFPPSRQLVIGRWPDISRARLSSAGMLDRRTSSAALARCARSRRGTGGRVCLPDRTRGGGFDSLLVHSGRCGRCRLRGSTLRIEWPCSARCSMLACSRCQSSGRKRWQGRAGWMAARCNISDAYRLPIPATAR